MSLDLDMAEVKFNYNEEEYSPHKSSQKQGRGSREMMMDAPESRRKKALDSKSYLK